MLRVRVKVMLLPTLGVALLAILVSDKSAWGIGFTVAVALLFPLAGSAVPEEVILALLL